MRSHVSSSFFSNNNHDTVNPPDNDVLVSPQQQRCSTKAVDRSDNWLKIGITITIENKNWWLHYQCLIRFLLLPKTVKIFIKQCKVITSIVSIPLDLTYRCIYIHISITNQQLFGIVIGNVMVNWLSIICNHVHAVGYLLGDMQQLDGRTRMS